MKQKKVNFVRVKVLSMAMSSPVFIQYSMWLLNTIHSSFIINHIDSRSVSLTRAEF